MHILKHIEYVLLCHLEDLLTRLGGTGQKRSFKDEYLLSSLAGRLKILAQISPDC